MVAMEKLDHQIGITSYQDLVTFGQDRPGHDLLYAIDASKIQWELGWFPKRRLRRDCVRPLIGISTI